MEEPNAQRQTHGYSPGLRDFRFGGMERGTGGGHIRKPPGTRRICRQERLLRLPLGGASHHAVVHRAFSGNLPVGHRPAHQPHPHRAAGLPAALPQSAAPLPRNLYAGPPVPGKAGAGIRPRRGANGGGAVRAARRRGTPRHDARGPGGPALRLQQRDAGLRGQVLQLFRHQVVAEALPGPISAPVVPHGQYRDDPVGRGGRHEHLRHH